MCHSYSSLLKSKITFLDPLLQNFQKPENGMNGKEAKEITTTMMRYPWTAKVPLLHPTILYLTSTVLKTVFWMLVLITIAMSLWQTKSKFTKTMMLHPWTAKVPLLHPVILYLMLMKWTCLYHWMISLVKEKLREVFGTSVIVTQTIIYHNLKKSSTMTW